MDVQFLIPINSSTRPSYVSCVKSGVIMSTRRSRTISESILDEDDKSASALALVVFFGVCRVKSVAKR